MISMSAISHSRRLLPAPVPNTFELRLTKTVFGSRKDESASAGRWAWRRCATRVKAPALGLKLHETARKVNAIIDSMANVVANTDPNRSPRTAGIASSRIPTIEIPNVHQAIGVLIGVKPAVDSL